MMKWAKSLFPINRSITGAGLRQTINFIIGKINKDFQKKKLKATLKCLIGKFLMNGKLLQLI